MEIFALGPYNDLGNQKVCYFITLYRCNAINNFEDPKFKTCPALICSA